jgi:hypothetical protein
MSRPRARDAKGRFAKRTPTPTLLTPEQLRALRLLVIPVEARSVLDEDYVIEIAPQFWRGKRHTS